MAKHGRCYGYAGLFDGRQEPGADRRPSDPKRQEPRNPRAALIQWGTTTRQRTLVSDLKHIEKRAKEEKFPTPVSVFVVGDVVSLRDSIAWFEQAPLFGKRILVTRSREQASALSEKPFGAGSRARRVFRRIRIREPLDSVRKRIEPLTASTPMIGSSSQAINGVKYFLERMMQKGLDIRDLKGKRLAAIGPRNRPGRWNLWDAGVDVVPKGNTRPKALVEAIERRGRKRQGVSHSPGQDRKGSPPRTADRNGREGGRGPDLRNGHPRGRGGAFVRNLRGRQESTR